MSMRYCNKCLSTLEMRFRVVVYMSGSVSLRCTCKPRWCPPAVTDNQRRRSGQWPITSCLALDLTGPELQSRSSLNRWNVTGQNMQKSSGIVFAMCLYVEAINYVQGHERRSCPSVTVIDVVEWTLFSAGYKIVRVDGQWERQRQCIHTLHKLAVLAGSRYSTPA